MSKLSKLGRPALLFYLRLTVGLILLILLVRLTDFEKVRQTLVSAKPDLMFVALLCILLNFTLMTYRWASILWVKRPDVPFSRLLRFYFVSGFLGQFLPMSSDVLMIYCSSKHTADPKGALSSVLLDRVIGAMSLGAVTMVALLALQQTDLAPIGSQFSYGVIALAILSIGAPLAFQTSVVTQLMTRLLGAFQSGVLKKIKDLHDTLVLYQNDRRAMTKVLFLSLGTNLLVISIYYLIARSFSSNIPMAYFFLFIPLVEFLAMVPVTVGGIGLLEGAFMYLFSAVGMPLETCLGIVLSRRVLLMVATVPGGVLFALSGLSTKRLPA